MTDRIAEIRARLEAATLGPWSWMATGEKDNSWALGVACDPESEEPITGEIHDWEAEQYEATGEPTEALIVEHVASNESGNAHLADASFIAHAPDDIRYLLDEVERLGAMERERNEYHENNEMLRERAMAAKAEVERSRESMKPNAETRDYLTRTIATIRNHRDADNCWPQWANHLADEVERMWAALHPDSGEAK